MPSVCALRDLLLVLHTHLKFDVVSAQKPFDQRSHDAKRIFTNRLSGSDSSSIALHLTGGRFLYNSWNVPFLTAVIPVVCVAGAKDATLAIELACIARGESEISTNWSTLDGSISMVASEVGVPAVTSEC